MHSVTVKRAINHNVDAVWSVLDDFGSVYKYNPSVEKSEILGDKLTGVGARRVCHFYDGGSLKETITQYTPNQGYGFTLSDFSLPLKHAASRFEVSPLGPQGSQLSITLEFEPKFGPVGWLMAKLLIRPTLAKALQGITQGLDDYLTTGQIVGERGELLAA